MDLLSSGMYARLDSSFSRGSCEIKNNLWTQGRGGACELGGVRVALLQ